MNRSWIYARDTWNLTVYTVGAVLPCGPVTDTVIYGHTVLGRFTNIAFDGEIIRKAGI